MPTDIPPAEATGPSGAVVTYTNPTASDLVDPSPSVTCLPASGSTFPLGDTTVSCTATDSSGNTSAPETFKVTVQDTTKPYFVGTPSDVTAEATSSSGATVNYAKPTAADLVDPSPTVSCAPASGSTFPFGDTTVTCNATDASGNTASSAATFTVTVRDTTPPAFKGTPVQIGARAELKRDSGHVHSPDSE